MINSTISPTTQKIATSTNVSSAGIKGNHALSIFFAENQFTSAPTTNSVGKIHQSVSFCSKVMVIATGASSHVMAYCDMMNSSASPAQRSRKRQTPFHTLPAPVQSECTSSIFSPLHLINSLRGQNVLPCARSVVFGMRNFIADRGNGSTSLRSCPAHS